MSATLYKNASIATMSDHVSTPYGLIENGALVAQGHKILWVGEAAHIPDQYKHAQIHDCQSRLITPGLIDCHTHLVYGGNRAREFELRLQGATYEEIARAGGGIISTVTHTRKASFEDLIKSALLRLDHLISEGVTTVEIKSGYGLRIEDELKMLRVARALAKERHVRICTTFLGAHAVAPEYKDQPDRYIDEVCIPALRQGAKEGLIDAVDAFCENIAFSPEQVARVFDVAKSLNLPVKIHAEQLSDQGGAAMAATYNALSADHLEFLGNDGIKAMAKSGTVAVLLPGAFYTLRETKRPPIDALKKAGVALAIATDSNPGSSPLTSILTAMNMGCTLFGLTPEETLAGVTKHGARALGLANQTGTLDAGKQAEFNIWDVSHPAELSYRIGFNPLHLCVNGVS